MKKKLLSLIAFCIFTFFINAQIPFSETLDVNNVDATVYSNGNFFWDLQSEPLYFVPGGSGKATIFSLSPWLAGFDSNDSLHLAAMRYVGQEYLPGPIVDIAQFNDIITAGQYNKIWKIDRWQIDEFKQEWQLGNVTSGAYTVPNVISTWPGNHPGLNERLAPYFDLNQDSIYNPMDGDYPEIKGDQMLWWVFNDNTEHTSSGGKALGVEFRVSFFACYYDNPPNDSLAAINNITFLNFEIVNRSHETYDSTMLGLYTDFDIGFKQDDYIGCHVDYNSFYAYNGSPVDGFGGLNSYGGPTPPPPAQSVTLLSGPEADPADGIDNNRNDTIDEPGECWGLSNFMYFNNSFGAMSDPDIVPEYYNYLNTVWKNGTALVYGGAGFPFDTSLVYVETDYAFPAGSDPQGWGQNGQIMPPWQENDSIYPPCDRRGLGSSGPFTFEPNEILSIDYALIFTQADTGSPFSSVIENIGVIEDVIEWYEKGICPSNHTVGIEANIFGQGISIFPNPAKEILNIKSIYNLEEIQIFNISGQLVQKTISNKKQVSIDVAGFVPGNYFIRATSKEEVLVRKFIVLR